MINMDTGAVYSTMAFVYRMNMTMDGFGNHWDQQHGCKRDRQGPLYSMYSLGIGSACITYILDEKA